MVTVLMIAAFVAFVAFLIWLGRKQQQQAVRHLEALAQRTGLTAQHHKKALGELEFLVTGQRDRRNAKFWSYTTGAGKSRRHWVAVAVQPREAGAVTFQLQPQGLGTKLAELFGVREIRVGDRAFDDAWFVRTSEPELFGAALVPEIREKLMAARTTGAKGEFHTHQGWVRYVEEGSFAREETVRRLENLLPVLADLADVAEVCARAKA